MARRNRNSTALESRSVIRGAHPWGAHPEGRLQFWIRFPKSTLGSNFDLSALELGDFIWTGGDCHIYNNHFEQVQTQLSRTPFAYPQMKIKRRPASIFDYEFEDFELVGYEHHAPIKGAVAV